MKRYQTPEALFTGASGLSMVKCKYLYEMESIT